MARWRVASDWSSRIRGRSWSWNGSRTTSRSGSRTGPGRARRWRRGSPKRSPRPVWAAWSDVGRTACREASSSGSPSRGSWRPGPEIVVLDEPTANLDPPGRGRLLRATPGTPVGALDDDRPHRASRRRGLGARRRRPGARAGRAADRRRHPRGGAPAIRRAHVRVGDLAPLGRGAFDAVDEIVGAFRGDVVGEVGRGRVARRLRIRARSRRPRIGRSGARCRRARRARRSQRQRQVDARSAPGRSPAAAPWPDTPGRRRSGRAAGEGARTPCRLRLPGSGGGLSHRHRRRRGHARARTSRTRGGAGVDGAPAPAARDLRASEPVSTERRGGATTVAHLHARPAPGLCSSSTSRRSARTESATRACSRSCASGSRTACASWPRRTTSGSWPTSRRASSSSRPAGS